MAVEAGGVGGPGVHEQASAADLVAAGERSGDRVLEKPGADAAAFVADVDAEAGEQGDWLQNRLAKKK